MQEPFVSGADIIIDKMVEHFSKPEEGFTLIFSANPFPSYQLELIWAREDCGGNGYNSPKLKMEGWLCPALFKYFEKTPPAIYVQCKEK